MPTKLTSEQQADLLYWPEIRDIPIIPAYTEIKKVFISDWQNMDFANVDFRAKLEAGEYDGGAAARLGPTISGKQAAYSIALDFDGLDAVRAWFGTWERVVALAQKSLVEWHGNKAKIHVILLSNESLPNRKIKIKDSLLEIRCRGCLLFVSPSIHTDGMPYSALGTKEIGLLDNVLMLKLKSKIETVCQGYMSDVSKSEYTKWMLDPKNMATFGVGCGRHGMLVHLGTHYYHKNNDGWHKLTDEQRKIKLEEWNSKISIPKPQDELDSIWRWIVEHHKEKRENERKKYGKEQKERKAEEQQKRSDYVDGLINKYNLKTLKDTKEIYCYDKECGIFVSGAEPIIEARLEKDFGYSNPSNLGLLTNHDVNEYLAHIRRRTYISRNDFDPSIEWLATKNCMINLRTGETQPFSPKFMNTSFIPVYYNNSPKRGFSRLVECAVLGDAAISLCPNIMKFLYEIMEPDDVEYVLDFLGYCLWRQYKFHIWILFNGAGQNGKTTLINLIGRFLGRHNVSGESLDRLLNERFAAANLYQKLVNVDADLSGDILKNTGKLKKLTGNDEYPAEFKFKPPFMFRNHAKMIFSCNEMPPTTDKSDAFFRRLLIVNFTHQFFGEKEDPNLLDKLSTDEELSGLLYVVLARLPHVLQKGIRPTTNETLEATVDKYQGSADPTEFFYSKALFNSKDSKDVETKERVYDSYKLFCRAKKLTAESEQAFSRKLRNKCVKAGRAGNKGKGIKQPYLWVGLQILDWKALEDKQKVLDFSEQQKEEMI